MSSALTGGPASRRPIRLWPGVLAAAILVLLRFIVPLVVPGAGGIAILGGLAGAAAIIFWWVLFSRAPWLERVSGIAAMLVALLVASRIVDPSIANGMMGMMLPLFAIPLMCVALVAAVALGRHLSSGARVALTSAAVLLACGSLALVRTGGVTGDGLSELTWRWTPTHEERLLAAGDVPLAAPATTTLASSPPVVDAPAAAAEPASAPSEPPPSDATAADTPASSATPRAADASAARPADTPLVSTGAVTTAGHSEGIEWAGFRGTARNGVVHGVRIETDWSTVPPVEIWRRPIGPGWSSFAVSGDRVYTQEQRGEEEIVSCYRLSTGEPVWMHRDPVRFWESNAGAGPRATPAVHDGRVYALGATGILNALDARTGGRIWSRNAAVDTVKEVPEWGFAGSPVVVAELVVVALSGRLAAYDLGTGDLRWLGPEGGGGYSSPHVATIEGVPQILLLRGSRTIAVSPADGTLLWEHTWPGSISILQPALATGRDVLVASGDMMGGMGIRRLAVSNGPGGWTVEERWTTRGLKPYFSDFVVHEGHAYGFDGSILASIDLADGERRWKGGRFGHGQLLLLADQDVLLVLSEQGELGLVSATPDAFRELARIPAIEGKTWNHPAIVGDVLLVRNGEEMAAFRLPVAKVHSPR
jgi:outer membrane protein assembly factor BamB